MENQVEDIEKKTGKAIPDYPYTLEGWTKYLKKHFEVREIKAIIELGRSGMLEDACANALEDVEKIDFEIFWELYNFKRGPKTKTQAVWMQMSLTTQRTILDVALPRYNRYIMVSGLPKCQPIVWLRQRRYKDDIPDRQQIERFANTVYRYFTDVLRWKSKYAAYIEPKKEVMIAKTEAFMYRYPDMKPIDVCGVLTWMVRTWDLSYRHLIKPTQAMSLSSWPKYFLSANEHIMRLKSERQRYMREKLERRTVQDLPFEETDDEIINGVDSDVENLDV